MYKIDIYEHGVTLDSCCQLTVAAMHVMFLCVSIMLRVHEEKEIKRCVLKAGVLTIILLTNACSL